MNICVFFFSITNQGLIQNEKVGIDGEKSAQISIVAKKTVRQRWLQIMIMQPKQTTHYNYFDVFSILCSYYVIDIIRKLELRLLVVIFYLRLNLGTPKLVCPKSVHRCWKQPVSTSTNKYSEKKNCVKVWSSYQIILYFSSCHKLDVSIFSHFPWFFLTLHCLSTWKNLFLNHFFEFLFSSVSISMYGFRQVSWLNLMTLLYFQY